MSYLPKLRFFNREINSIANGAGERGGKNFFYEFRSIFRTTHVKNAFFLIIFASTTLHPA